LLRRPISLTGVAARYEGSGIAAKPAAVLRDVPPAISATRPFEDQDGAANGIANGVTTLPVLWRATR